MFLPSNYKAPSGNYFKFRDGENTFRILSSAIVGYEYWTTDNKPIRSKELFRETPDIKLDKEEKPTKVKHFWSFIIYNQDTNTIQVMEITQSGIQKAIEALVNNKKWGDPKNYDITISKSGSGLETEYSVMSNPHTPLDKTIKAEFEDKGINLNALYEGGDPFEKQEKKMSIDDIPDYLETKK